MAYKQTIFNMKRGIFLVLLLGSLLVCGFALPSLAKLPVPQSTQQSQITTGKALYDAGRYSEAVEVMRQAVQEYQKQGDTLKQAVALGNLSLSYQQLGQWSEAQQAISDSLRLQGVKNLPVGEKTVSFSGASSPKKVLAQTFVIQGRLLLSKGQAQEALQNWQQAEQLFVSANEPNGAIMAKLNQAQVLQVLGSYRPAIKILEEVNATLKAEPDSVHKIVAFRSLGDALQLVGDLEKSRKALQQSLKIAQKLNHSTEIGASLFSLGNNARSDNQLQQASSYYSQTIQTSPSLLTRTQALLNQLSLTIETKKYTEAQAIIPRLQSQINQLPVSRTAIYAKINFAESLMKIGNGELGISLSPMNNEVLTVLATAIKEARSIGDTRAQAYALGEMGKLYETTKQFRESQKLTEQALVISQSSNASEITYQLQWQLGRLLKNQGDINGAIKYYDAAVDTLQILRSDLVAVNQDVQFSFRESVEPVYRESVALLLQSQPEQPDVKILDRARQRIEALQLAELDNFFREACLQGQKVLLDKVVDRDNATAAILYPIILPDTLQVIVKIPNQQLKLYSTKISQGEVEKIVTQLRRNFTDPSALKVLKAQSQQVYNWLVKPVEEELAKTQVNTLVFVPDGVLRNLPLSALYDGEKYLVEKYAIALSPGLQLLDPKPIVKQKLNALTAGLSTPPPEFSNFAPLPAIKAEFELIAKAGVTTTTLLDNKFTSKALEREVKDIPFNVVHLATHGKFSSRADDTFILAADGPINVRQFDSLLRSRDQNRPEAVQLLVLSACQTAEGDKRAALGLAGVAIRAGARSTVASLWQIDDESTAIFVGSFYRELKDGQVSKAEALRRAQLQLLQHPNYRSPSYWSAYVLIGNWL